MAKERLSKLQRWILEKIYEDKKAEDYNLEGLNEKRIMIGDCLFRANLFYWLMQEDKKGQDEKKIQVLLTNSIQNLIKKGLIRQLEFVFHPYQLTEKGLSLIRHNLK